MAPSDHTGVRERLRAVVPLALIGVAATVPFLTGVTSPFTLWDDNYYVTTSQFVQAPGWAGFRALWDFMTALRFRQVEFFPLRDSIDWALWQLFGANPVPYHLTSLALHALSSLLVRALALRLGFSQWVAFAAALLFATHPVHVESVTWISGLKDPLFLSLMLGSLVSYLRYRESVRPRDYALALVLLALALASKSLALATAPLMVVAERLIGTPTRWRLIALRATGPFAITAVSFWHIVANGEAAGIIWGPHGGTWASHWQLMAWALTRYVQQAFVPMEFRLHYCFPMPRGFADPRLWAAAVTLPALALAGVWAFRKSARLAFLFAWFALCLGPVANIVPFPSLMADRYLYSPTVATAIATAWLLERLRLRTALLAAAVLTLAAVTAGRALTWQHESDLWDEVAGEPNCWQDGMGTAVNVLLQWASTQPDPKTSADDFAKVLKHRALRQYLGSEQVCERFLQSVLARPQPDPQLELRAAELSAALCEKNANSWVRIALANWQQHPEISSRAMEKAFALEPVPHRRWQLGMARFAAHDPRARADLEEALRWNPETECPNFQQWRARVPAEREGEVAGLEALCAVDAGGGR